MILLAGGCWVMVPQQVRPSAAYRTEFGVLLETRPQQSKDAKSERETSPASSASSAAAAGSGGTMKHIARLQRIYSNPRLLSASTAFLTLGGMDY